MLVGSLLLGTLAVSRTAPCARLSHPHTTVPLRQSAQPACPAQPLPRATVPDVGAAVGPYPLWVGWGGSRWPYPPSYGTYTRPYKTLFISKVSFKGRVTLRGGSLSGGPPLYFSDRAQPTPVRTLTLDPQHPLANAGTDRSWSYFPTGVDVSKPGCYYLEARWPHGQWRTTFVIGR